MNTTKGVFVPAWGNLLVELDSTATVTPAGLVIPETYVERQLPSTALVLAAGWEAPPVFCPGTRVVFGRFAATVFHDNTAIVASMNIEGYIREEDAQELPPEGITEAWAPLVQPPPGELFVRRMEMPAVVEKIIIPAGVELHVRSSEAEVMAVAADIAETCPFKVGDGVFLHPTVQRGFSFGRRGEIVFNRCTPRLIAGFVSTLGAVPGHTKPEGEGHREVFVDTDPHGDRFNEGDRRGF